MCCEGTAAAVFASTTCTYWYLPLLGIFATVHLYIISFMCSMKCGAKKILFDQQYMMGLHASVQLFLKKQQNNVIMHCEGTVAGISSIHANTCKC